MIGLSFILSPLVNLITRPFYMTPVLKQADVIVVFPVGVEQSCWPDRFTLERESYGLTLLHEGLSRYGKIIFTGGADGHVNAARCMAQYAENLGFDKNQLIIEPEAETTYENALYTYQIMQQHHWQSALLVTSATHIRRAVKTLRSYPVQVYPAPTPIEENPHLWDADRFTSFYWVVYETFGLLKYKLYHLDKPLNVHGR